MLLLSGSTPSSFADDNGGGGPAHASEVAIFYYPWYSTTGHDGSWRHWDQNGRVPPISIGGNFYPAIGPYSSADTSVISTQMQQIAAAGVDTVVVSWWGQGTWEDNNLSLILGPAHQLGLKVAVHIEPYGGRNDRTLMSDYNYLRNKGIRDFYLYQVQSMSTAGVRAIADANSDDRVFGEPANEAGMRNGTFMQWAQDAHLNGIYTYDPRGYSASDFAGICSNARNHGLLCMPSVGPGWNATRATKIPAIVSRDNGAVYDRYWQAAIDAHADIVTVTSFNEWHEGTQIEPAAGNQCISAENYCYTSYEGAYGKHGTEAAYAYLSQTLQWSIAAKGHAPDLSQRLTIVENALGRNDGPAIAGLKSIKPGTP